MTLSLSTFRAGAAALLVGASCLTAAAQTMPATVDEPVTIRFYNYNLAGAGIGKDATLEMIDSFQKANPNITPAYSPKSDCSGCVRLKVL